MKNVYSNVQQKRNETNSKTTFENVATSERGVMNFQFVKMALSLIYSKSYAGTPFFISLLDFVCYFEKNCEILKKIVRFVSELFTVIR